MSFSSAVKDELAGLPLGNECCRLAELAGIMLAAGSMHLADSGVQAQIATESPAIAQRVYKLIKAIYGAAPAHRAARKAQAQQKTSAITSFFLTRLPPAECSRTSAYWRGGRHDRHQAGARAPELL